MTLHLFLAPDGQHWIGSWPELDQGTALTLHPLAHGWPSIWREAAPWLLSILAAYVESQERGLVLTEIVCCGLPPHIVNTLKRGAWPEELAPYVDEFRRLPITLSYGRISRRERAMLDRYAESAPAQDAVVMGMLGLGAVGAMGAL